jgi:hypothetical protein
MKDSESAGEQGPGYHDGYVLIANLPTTASGHAAPAVGCLCLARGLSGAEWVVDKGRCKSPPAPLSRQSSQVPPARPARPGRTPMAQVRELSTGAGLGVG